MQYPAPGDVHAIHRAIVESDANTEPRIRTLDAVESALLYVSEGYFGERFLRRFTRRPSI